MPAAPTPAQDPRRLTARELMTPRPVTVTMSTPLSDVHNLMETRGIVHFPVVDESGHLVALLSERDLRDAMPSVLTVEDPDARRRFLRVTRVDQVAVKNPPSGRLDMPVLDVITQMRGHRAGALPIVDKGLCVGIISSGDLINLLERTLRTA